ncbi:MAG: universal stress protein [Flavobacteriales bacterium]|nr:universal stress protein [Flavobacteriales bacterium]
MERKILVPIDYTKVSENAVDHAQNLALHIGAEVYLLHLVSRAEHLSDAKTRMQAFKEHMSSRYEGVKFLSTVRVGSIFDDISDVAAELEVVLIVMGTHGMRGFQFLVGSNALRIVSSSRTPFIIVQEKGIKENGYDDIVVPLDLHKETKQKLSLVVNMAKYFNARVHLISPHETDEFLQNTLKRNLAFASQKMKEAGIEHKVVVADKDKDFDDAIISYSVVHDIDLISIMNLKENSLAGLLGGGYTQKVVTNEAQIAVMLINPAQTGHIDIFGV